MTPGLWGVLSALCWGHADFVARFTGRAVGQIAALLGMLAVSSAALTAWVLASRAPLSWEGSGLWLLLLTGVGTLVGTLFLYVGLARGPVSIVAPIVAAYPALVVAIAVLQGARLGLPQWLFFFVTLLGIVTVGWSAGSHEEAGGFERRHLRVTIFIALASAATFAVGLSAGQHAAPLYGSLQTVWVARLVALAGILPVLLWKGNRRPVALVWWPFLTLQGLLDAGGYLALFQGSTGPGAEMAAITASGYAVVTVLLARVFLREVIGHLQWAGIGMVFLGVAVLAS